MNIERAYKLQKIGYPLNNEILEILLDAEKILENLTLYTNPRYSQRKNEYWFNNENICVYCKLNNNEFNISTSIWYKILKKDDVPYDIKDNPNDTRNILYVFSLLIKN